MSSKYDETYDIVISMAKTKMMMNAHKGNIEDLSPSQLCSLGAVEFKELFEAIEDKSSQTHIIEEVADVLNFAVAAAYKAIEEYRSRKNV